VKTTGVQNDYIKLDNNKKWMPVRMITSSDMAHLEKMINFELKVEKNF